MGLRQTLAALPAWGWAVLGVALLRIPFAAWVPLTPEEAYHWNFARHPDWSYFDHPPMIAWAIAAGRLVFGDTPLGVRAVPILFSTGTMLLLAAFARRIYGERAAGWAVLIHLGQPVTLLVGSAAFPDCPELFFWALAMWLVWDVLDRGRGPVWVLAGMALGATGLSKYTGVFLGVSVLIFLLSSPRDRRWLASPWPYLGALAALLVLFPVFYWNHTHDWASFRFQGVERIQESRGVGLRSSLNFLWTQILGFMPLSLPLAALTVLRIRRSPRREERYLYWCVVPMLLFFAAISFMRVVHLMWPMPAYLALTVAMAGSLVLLEDRVSRITAAARPWLLGIPATAVLVASLHAAFFFPGLSPFAGLYGWPEVAGRVRSIREKLPPDSFILGLGRKYTCPSQLAFHLRAPFDVQGKNAMGSGGSQYDFWQEDARLEGKDAVIVVEDGDRLPGMLAALRARFASVEPAGDLSVPVGRATLLKTPPLRFFFFTARGYKPVPAHLRT